MARNYRLEIIESLGGQCQWHEGCTVTDPDMLHVDHVNGAGGKERASFGGRNHAQNGSRATAFKGGRDYYKHILEHLDTGNYQVLCANHNLKKYALERRAKKLAKAAV